MLGRFAVLAGFSLLALAGCSAPSQQEEEEEVAAAELSSALDDPSKGVNTDALLVMRDGKILSESYGRGYDANTKHLSWSMAKSIAGILVAQEIERNNGMSLTSPIRNYLPEIQSPAARIVDVLQMSSGVAFNEEYSGVPVTSDATRMLYMKGPETGFVPFIESLAARPSDARPASTSTIRAAIRIS